MCYTVSIFSQTHVIETDLGQVFEDATEFVPYVHVSGFVHPELPIGVAEDGIRMMRWGLVPRWTRSRQQADEMRGRTLNARSESAYEKPSYRDAVRKRRGLLPVNGFIEWRHEGKLKIPHMVRMRSSEIFTLGCIWEEWVDPESGQCEETFSILTTEANILMSHVHNSAMRMPVVIPHRDRSAWLLADDREQVQPMLRPLEDGLLEAFPITREVSKIRVNTTEPQMIESVGETVA
ncbi:MAG: SOS response-associated peptidase [Candidatus Kapabacteria bacterium]|nr:SOS response-associated peptidase [Candidatus Kapabacteria bacterium]